MENKPFGRFLIVWSGQLISSIGAGFTAFALGVYVYQQTHTATSYTIIILCSFLPSILLRPLGGVLGTSNGIAAPARYSSISWPQNACASSRISSSVGRAKIITTIISG